ncbi:Rieske (2Fe-2S) protein [Pajaroellobacter abortibovis]|uniref:Rieske (2Fe-2S) protein n=1 Tax=Pajaroellobacter abortibovis TaxID=1882918 RepID=UPI00156160A9|nr:Rieske (2Fe-2S) protein [Pajaroellobacter abortibovis]
MTPIARIPLHHLQEKVLTHVPPPSDIVITLIQGVPYAIADRCAHAGARLSEGTLLQTHVRCPQHGYLFDIKTGKLITPKGLCEDQLSYPTSVEKEEVVIWNPLPAIVSP